MMTKNETTTRPDYVCPEVWTKIGKAAQNREKQEWAKEDPKLDNVRKLRGIYFLDPDDREYSEILKNAVANWQDLWLPRCHSEGGAKQHPNITDVMQNNGNEKEFKTTCDCAVESFESTRHRAESLQSRNHEDHTAGKGFTSMTHYNLVHMFIPMPQAMKISDAKSCRGQGMEELETIPAWELEKVKSKKEGYSGCTKRQKESPLCYTDGHTSPQERGFRTQISKNTKEKAYSVVTL